MTCRRSSGALKHKLPSTSDRIHLGARPGGRPTNAASHPRKHGAGASLPELRTDRPSCRHARGNCAFKLNRHLSRAPACSRGAGCRPRPSAVPLTAQRFVNVSTPIDAYVNPACQAFALALGSVPNPAVSTSRAKENGMAFQKSCPSGNDFQGDGA